MPVPTPAGGGVFVGCPGGVVGCGEAEVGVAGVGLLVCDPHSCQHPQLVSQGLQMQSLK